MQHSKRATWSYYLNSPLVENKHRSSASLVFFLDPVSFRSSNRQMTQTSCHVTTRLL